MICIQRSCMCNCSIRTLAEAQARLSGVSYRYIYICKMCVCFVCCISRCGCVKHAGHFARWSGAVVHAMTELRMYACTYYNYTIDELGRKRHPLDVTVKDPAELCVELDMKAPGVLPCSQKMFENLPTCSTDDGATKSSESRYMYLSEPE